MTWVISNQVETAREEAKRFLQRLSEYEEAMDEDDRYSSRVSMYRAAMLRASMDLTRALAAIRKSGATTELKR